MCGRAAVFKIIVATALLSCSSNCSFAQQAANDPRPCDGKNFQRARISPDAPSSIDFQGAVFHLTLQLDSAPRPIEEGTGYLIDAMNGYVVTAAHVIEKACGNAKVRIIGKSPKLSESEQLELGLNEGLIDTPNDVAILQITNRSLLAKEHIEPLEIALHFRPSPEGHYTIGYPGGEVSPSPQTVQFTNVDEKTHLLKVSQHVEQGSSGSPLIDSEGAVVATLTDDKYMDTALYRPLVAVRHLLDGLSAGPGVSSLDELILTARNNSATPDYPTMIRKLQWTSGNPTNLELYEWMQHLRENSEVYEASEGFLNCIYTAYSDREMIDAIPEKVASRAPALHGQLLVERADQALYSQPDLASKYFDNANILFRELVAEAQSTGIVTPQLKALADAINKAAVDRSRSNHR
jgi:trypsin-like peptidase